MKFKGSIIITDPCYICLDEDWDNLAGDCDMDLMSIGMKDSICESTIYGDWSCTTFSCKKQDPIEARKSYLTGCENPFEYGRFCADAGMVCVCYVKDLLIYNPKFFEECGQWCYTLIPDFEGEVEYCVDDEEAFIIGKGNKNFFTCQTGL